MAMPNKNVSRINHRADFDQVDLTSLLSSLEGVPAKLNHLLGVMAGLVPAIHVFPAESPQERTWMPATSAGMTAER